MSIAEHMTEVYERRHDIGDVYAWAFGYLADIVATDDIATAQSDAAALQEWFDNRLTRSREL